MQHKIEELKNLVHSTQRDINPIQETKLTQKACTPKIPRYTTIRTDREHTRGGGLITLIKEDITFTNINIPKVINTHKTKLQLIKIHIGKTKDITVVNVVLSTKRHDVTTLQHRGHRHRIVHTIRHQTQYSQVT